MVTLVRIARRLIESALRWVVLLFRSTESVHAENLFLRRQLADSSRMVSRSRSTTACSKTMVVLRSEGGHPARPHAVRDRATRGSPGPRDDTLQAFRLRQGLCAAPSDAELVGRPL